MKLLFDENLSDRLVPALLPAYPGCTHVKNLNLLKTSDTIIWNHAKQNDYIIVSKDADFHQRSLLLGHPPKLIYLKVGNCPTSHIQRLLTSSVKEITAFAQDTRTSLMILS